MIFRLPKEINHDDASFETFAYLHSETKELAFDDIEINMEKTVWFAADMCAAFGAVLYSLEKRLNTVNLTNISSDVKNVLSKNGFLSRFGGVEISDQWGTTISYQQFDGKSDRDFVRYIENEFIHRSELPEMSTELLKKFSESISEIFINAILHSQTQMGIFSCGQLYPKKDQLDFTIVDLGIGMRENIKELRGLDFSPEEAIVWATEGNSTTNRARLPGGLGLKLLCKFIDLNQGSIKIVSDAGYWKRENRKIFTESLSNPFPGTIVSIEINTADTKIYSLSTT